MSAVDSGGPEIREPDHDIPVDKDFSGPFFQEIGRRKLEGRDAKILVTADDAQTGVGKSNLCDFLGYVLDTTEDGFSPDKIAIDRRSSSNSMVSSGRVRRSSSRRGSNWTPVDRCRMRTSMPARPGQWSVSGRSSR